MRKLVVLCLLSFCLSRTPAHATIFSQVHGVVHDPQHRPIAGARIQLHAANSAFAQTTVTAQDGAFTVPAIPLGDYILTISQSGFATAKQALTLASDTSPILHIELQLGTVQQTATVTADATAANVDTVTPTTLISRDDIAQTPGADRTNSLAMITDYVPGAYMTHDMLHIRGGHQVSWLIDGVQIPNTNIASNLAAQIDPKDIDYIEVQRGSYTSDVGDRTYGVFNVVPRTGFERDRQAELILSAGNFFQTDDQLNFGDHSEKFAWYASLSGNRSDYGLAPPIPQVLPRRRQRLRRLRILHLQPHSQGSVPPHHATPQRLLPDPLRPRPRQLRKPAVRLQRPPRHPARNRRHRRLLLAPHLQPIDRPPGLALLPLQPRRLPTQPQRHPRRHHLRPHLQLRRRASLHHRHRSRATPSRPASTPSASTTPTSSAPSSTTPAATPTSASPTPPPAASSRSISPTTSKPPPGSPSSPAFANRTFKASSPKT